MLSHAFIFIIARVRIKNAFGQLNYARIHSECTENRTGSHIEGIIGTRRFVWRGRRKTQFMYDPMGWFRAGDKLESGPRRITNEWQKK